MKSKLMLFALVMLISAKAMAETVLLGNVPFIAQSPPGDWQQNKNCGPAAALMLGGYYGNFEPAVEDLKNELDWLYSNGYINPQTNAEYYDGNVTTTNILKSLLENYFTLDLVVKKSGVDWPFVQAQIKKGNPVIVGVNIQMNPNKLGHFMVVVGYDDDEIIVNDSGLAQGALKKYDLEKFFSSWQTSNNSVVYVDANNVTWHPDGTLIKTADKPEIYILLGGEKHWIVDEKTFKAHNFDWQKVITVSDDEMNCYADSDKIDWQPYREAFKVKDKYYLMEKSSATSIGCAVYEFGSEFSYASWQLTAPLQELTAINADQKYFSKCNSGGLLYVRDGTVVHPEFFVIGYNTDAKFVATGNGALLPFDSDETFTALGYDKMTAMFMKENDEKGSYYGFGKIINAESTQQCVKNGFVIAGLPAQAGGNNDAVPEEAVECPGLDCEEPAAEDPIEEELPAILSPTETPDAVGAPFDATQGDIEKGKKLLPFEETPDVYESNEPIDAGSDDSGSNDTTLIEKETGQPLPPKEELPETISSETTIPDQPDADDEIVCTVTCPIEMTAFIWFGEMGEVSGQTATMSSTVEEICLRGQPWIDFDCACNKPWLWSCFDPSVALVECNQKFQKVIPGVIDPQGEGEVWFTDFTCYQEE